MDCASLALGKSPITQRNSCHTAVSFGLLLGYFNPEYSDCSLVPHQLLYKTFTSWAQGSRRESLAIGPPIHVVGDIATSQEPIQSRVEFVLSDISASTWSVICYTPYRNQSQRWVA
jgi:hypothetical protein